MRAAERAFLSVVIPTRDRPALLARCLDALAAQDWPPERREIIVVDDGSRTPLPPPVGATLLRLDVPAGPAAARNRGWRAARGEFVLFLDDDVRPAAGHHAALMAALTAAPPSVAAIEGPVEPDDPAAARANPFVRTLATRGGGHTANIAYRRSVLEAVGGFDEGFTGAACEDYDLHWRVLERGLRVDLEPGAVVGHAMLGEQGVRELWRRSAMVRPALVRLFTRHPARFPPPFLPGALMSLVRRLLRRPTPAAITAYIALHDAALLIAQRRLLPRRPRLYGRWILYVAGSLASLVRDYPRMRALCRDAAVAHAKAS